jgi:two-component system, OmpR family, sensor kinase
LKVLALSLSARLTALVLGLLLTALLLIGVTLGLRIRDFAETQAERAVYGQLSLIVQAGETNTSDYEYQAFQSLVGAAQTSRSWGFLKTGSQTYVTDSLSRPLPPPELLRQAGQTGRAAWNDLRLLSDGRGNLLGLALNTADSATLTQGVVQTYAIVALGALLLAGAAVLGLLRLGLHPLRVMATRAARLGVDDLAERMPVAPPADELHVLATSLNRMLARLQDAFARLSAEEARTRAFAADASHELRTPLSAIAGSLEVLERAPVGDDETRARLITNLRRESRRAGRLVDDLLTLTRMGAGEGLNTARLELRPLLENVLDVMRSLAPHLNFVLEAAGQTTLNADPERLEGALLNLLRNAAVHTPAGKTVTLKALANGPNLRLSVLNPAHLAPEFLPRLFDRFSRGPNAVPSGSGLGLAIVQAVAQAHGGETFAEQHGHEFAEQHGHELEVGITLPLAQT